MEGGWSQCCLMWKTRVGSAPSRQFNSGRSVKENFLDRPLQYYSAELLLHTFPAGRPH